MNNQPLKEALERKGAIKTLKNIPSQKFDLFNCSLELTPLNLKIESFDSTSSDGQYQGWKITLKINCDFGCIIEKNELNYIKKALGMKSDSLYESFDGFSIGKLEDDFIARFKQCNYDIIVPKDVMNQIIQFMEKTK